MCYALPVLAVDTQGGEVRKRVERVVG